MNVRVKIEQQGAFFCASCPDLPGCACRAGTREEAEKGIRMAVAGYVASLHAASSVRVQVHHCQEQDRLSAGHPPSGP